MVVVGPLKSVQCDRPDHVNLHNAAVLDQLLSFHWDISTDCLLALLKCAEFALGKPQDL